MRRIVLLAAAVLAAGCTLNPSGKTASPSPSPLPSGVANIVNTGDETLAPGRYTQREFAPRVTFDVDGPWYGRQVYNGFFDIQQGSSDDPHVISVQFARPDVVFGSEGATEPDDAADAVAILESNPNLTVVETGTSEMGGLEGSQITIENGGDEATEIMSVPVGTIAMLPDRRLWMAFFDTEQGLLAIMVGGSVEQWDAALAAAEPVLESIEIEQ